MDNVLYLFLVIFLNFSVVVNTFGGLYNMCVLEDFLFFSEYFQLLGEVIFTQFIGESLLGKLNVLVSKKLYRFYRILSTVVPFT